jgi:predicted AlkP superfamily phosphohydrolase/phosphomutase
MSCNLENAYLNAPCPKKIWFEVGIECGEDHDKVYIVVHSLYGLKSAGAAFHSLLAQILQDIGYTPMKADPNVWLRMLGEVSKRTKDGRLKQKVGQG